MKKMFKTMVSAVMAVTMLAGSALNTSAYTSSEYIKEVGEQVYAKVIKTCEYDENNENLIPLGKRAIDITSEDFREFVKNAEKSDEKNRLSNGDWYLITYNILGEDDNENLIISDYYCSELKGFDENNNPIAAATEFMEEDISISYGVTDDLWTGEIKSGFNRWLIKFDENGEPVRYVTYRQYNGEGAGKGVTRTVDLHTGEDIIIKFYDCDFHYEDYLAGKKPYEVIKRGDATLDGSVDIRDVTMYARHIVKIVEIPSYADMVADLDKNGTIDVKDLASLKSYLIGEKDSL